MSREIQRLEIIFKEPMATFKAGDVVAGSVQMDLVQEFKLKGIKLILHGTARAYWDEQRAYTKGSAGKLSHRNAEVCLDETVYIVSKGDQLAAGRHNWPFTVRLPLYLPASFEDQPFGKVQYFAKLIVERPWKGAIEVSRHFTVLGMLDLNTDPEAKKPGENQLETMVGPGCCKSGPISGHVIVPRRGYTVGQSIPFSVKIDNGSRKTLSVRVVLSQHSTFHADKLVRRANTVLKVVSRPSEVKAGESITWDDEIKDVPPVQPSRLGGGCKTIEVKYMLTMIASPSGPGKDFEIPVEIIIGTVPLRKQEPGSQMLTVKAVIRRLSAETDQLMASGINRA
jgi:hypothetical protein